MATMPELYLIMHNLHISIWTNITFILALYIAYGYIMRIVLSSATNIPKYLRHQLHFISLNINKPSKHPFNRGLLPIHSLSCQKEEQGNKFG